MNTRRVELVCAKELIFRYVAKPHLRKRDFLAKFVLENAAVLESNATAHSYLFLKSRFSSVGFSILFVNFLLRKYLMLMAVNSVVLL